MFGFNNYLLQGEEISYIGSPVKKNLVKQIAGMFLGLIITLFILVLSSMKIDLSAIIIMVIALLFVAIFGYLLFDNFKKIKEIKGVYYCITNYRVLKYDEKNNKMYGGILFRYNYIYPFIGNGYGDVLFKYDMQQGIYIENDLNIDKEILQQINESFSKQGIENADEIKFLMIDNPLNVAEIAWQASDSVVKKIRRLKKSSFFILCIIKFCYLY